MERKMKGIIATGIATVGLLCTSITALAGDTPEADLTMGFYSKYVWRGQELSKDSLVIQPSMTISYKGFGFNLWGNLDTDLEGVDKGKWNETDMTVSYDGSYSMVNYGLGWIYYALDGTDDTQDIYATVGLDVLLAPTLTIYRDISGLDVTYCTLGISHSLSISDKIGLDLGAQGSYLDDNDNDYNALHDGIISAALPVTVNENITIGPELYYVFPLSSDAKTSMRATSFSGNDDTFFYGGVSASFAF
jgi:hypothetical protein